MELAVRARLIGLAVIGVMLAIVNPGWDILYYEAILLGFALIGLAQRHVARVERSNAELFLIVCDFALLTVAVVVPNPFSGFNWPLAMSIRTGIFFSSILQIRP